jgi:acetyl esterase/lipase
VILTRRGLMAAAGASALVGCGTSTERPARRRQGPDPIRYGDEHPSQFAELQLPSGSPRATVVLLHGGYWMAGAGLEQMDPMVGRLTELGFATWNVEYRRTGAGGGFPHTFTDVAAAMDRLAGTDLPEGLADNVVVAGHSAGGHLAAWVASRTARTPGGAPEVRPRGAISLAGILDLVLAGTVAGSRSPVAAFMGGAPSAVPERYALADPAQLVPAPCPVWAVSAEDDLVVPPEQSERYVARATAAGGRAERVVVPGDHYSVIRPGSETFDTVEQLIESASA